MAASLQPQSFSKRLALMIEKPVVTVRGENIV
jgi:hypothetical protein